jgi:hypothetical protein
MSQPVRRPAVIWFLSLNPDTKAEKRMWDDVDVAAASRYFDCVKIYAEDIETKAEREKYAKIVPTVIMLDAKGSEVSRLVGTSASSTSIFAGMQRASTGVYSDTLTKLVAKYMTFIERLDKTQSKVDVVEMELKDHQDHIARHDCARGRKAVKECEEELDGLRAARDKVLEEEKALLNPPRKDDKRPEGTKTAN